MKSLLLIVFSIFSFVPLTSLAHPQEEALMDLAPFRCVVARGTDFSGENVVTHATLMPGAARTSAMIESHLWKEQARGRTECQRYKGKDRETCLASIERLREKDAPSLQLQITRERFDDFDLYGFSENWTKSSPDRRISPTLAVEIVVENKMTATPLVRYAVLLRADNPGTFRTRVLADGNSIHYDYILTCLRMDETMGGLLFAPAAEARTPTETRTEVQPAAEPEKAKPEATKVEEVIPVAEPEAIKVEEVTPAIEPKATTPTETPTEIEPVAEPEVPAE